MSDVGLEIPSADTAVFTGTLNGPSDSPVWARAWLASELDGTVAEAASQRLKTGDTVMLTVTLRDHRVPENAFIRIESAPFKTEHVVWIKLPPSE